MYILGVFYSACLSIYGTTVGLHTKYPRPSHKVCTAEILLEMYLEPGVQVLMSPIPLMHPPLYLPIGTGHKSESSYMVYNQVYPFSFRLIMIDK